MKNMPGDIIILHLYTINKNQMMYGSCYMECDRQNILSTWTIFCPFTPLAIRKITILKKNVGKAWRNYYFTHLYLK